jgi:hypothetical protein
MTVRIKVDIDLEFECSECGTELTVLQSFNLLRINSCKNCCKESPVKTGRCYDCKNLGNDELSCKIDGGDNLDGCCKLFERM